MNRSLLALVLLPALALAAPVPKAKESKLLVTTAKQFILMNPDGSEAKVVYDLVEKEYIPKARLSPDGKRIAFASISLTGVGRMSVRVRDVAGGDSTVWAEMDAVLNMFWSSDGTALYGTYNDVKIANQPGKALYGNRSWVIDTKTGKQSDLDIPGEYQLIGQMPGSEKVICLRVEAGKPRPREVSAYRLETVTTHPLKFDPKVVVDEEVSLWTYAVFPDGKRWLGSEKQKMVVFDGEKSVPWDGTGRETSLALSPDGKQVAYTLFHQGGIAKPDKPLKHEVWTADSDLSKPKKVWESEVPIYFIDWR